MDKKSRSPLVEDTRTYYEIRLKGRLEEHWSDWLGGLKITQDGDYSLLAGAVPDQAALHGILMQIRDLGLTLISITSKSMEDKATKGDESSGSGRV